MTPCPEREALLTADLDTLRGRGDERLAAHLATCADCARAARRIVDEMERLDALLDGSGDPGFDASALVRRARAAASGPARDSAGRGGRPVRWGTAATLLAAAAVTFLLLRPAEPPPPPGPAARAPAALPPLVEEAPGRDVAILETDDPDITVLWFF